MSQDHDNPTSHPSSAAAAAPAPESEVDHKDEVNSPVEDGAESPAHTEPAYEPATSAETSATPEEGAAAEAATAEETPAMSQLLEEYAEPQKAAPDHEIREGKVVAYTEQGVVVDLGLKSEALIPAAEFTETDLPRPEPGSAIEVQRTGETKEGYVLVSYQKVLRRRAWEKMDAAFKAHETLTGKIVDRIKGGLVVDIGVRAFLPGSQYDVRPTPNLDALVGQEIPCRITKLNRKRGNVVVSRRAILEEELQSKRQALLDSLVEGQRMTGKVKNITEYGVFVDLGGLDGLLHVTDLSWARVKNPSEVVAPDQEIEVQVLKFDREKGRVSLGRKQLLPDPWAGAAEKYPPGEKRKGKVVGIADYGCFVELETGVEGLVHISEMNWSKKVQHPSKLVKTGDEVEVMVLDIRPEERRISLGMKQAQPDPWQTLAEKYPVGTVVTGKVRNIADFGAFIEIEEGFDGLVHVSDVSWTGRVKNPHEHFKKGETVTAKVLKIDMENRRVSLGIKQVHDIWANWFAAHRVGEILKGKVSRLATFGAFVELAEGIEGLCHISEIEERRRRDEGGAARPACRSGAPGKQAGALEAGKEYDFKVIKLNREQRKIGLSYRAAIRQAEKREIEEYRSSKSSSTATIGDAILSKRESL